MRYRRLLSYADKDEYRQDPEVMGWIKRYKATIESALSRAEVCVESLDAVLSEDMENVFPDSSTNAPKQHGSGDFWSVRQVDEVVSSGGQVVMEFSPGFRLPSDGERVENSLIIHPLYSHLSKNIQNGFPHSSTNALEDNDCVSSAHQVDEMLSSGEEVVMEFPPSCGLPSRNETAQNTSMRPLPPKEAFGPEKFWRRIHTAISFQLWRNKSENPRPSNDAILRHFRQFGNVVQFHCNSAANGYIDYSSHQEALLSLSEPSQHIDGWLLKRCAIKKYPQDLTDLAETFTVLFFQLSFNTSKGVSPSEEDLKRHLSRFGNIVHFELLSNPSRGYVEYVSHSEARRALSEPIHEVGNRNLYLHPVKEFPATRPLDAQLSENKQSGFPDSSMNAGEENSDFSVVRQVDEVVSSGGEVVMGLPPCFHLPSPSETTQNSSIRQLPQEDASQTEVTSNKVHTAISFELVRNKSKNPRPSNGAILRHFRQFGNVVQFHCNLAASDYVGYSSHQEALLSLSEPSQQIDGWLLKCRAIKRYPQNLAKLAQTFTVLFYRLHKNASSASPPSSGDIEEHWSRFGRITHFQYLLNPPRGYVEYSSHSEAKKALSEPIHEVGTWILYLHPIKEFPAAYLQLGNTEVPRSRRELGNTSNAFATAGERIRFTTPSPQRVKRRRRF